MQSQAMAARFSWCCWSLLAAHGDGGVHAAVRRLGDRHAERRRPVAVTSPPSDRGKVQHQCARCSTTAWRGADARGPASRRGAGARVHAVASCGRSALEPFAAEYARSRPRRLRSRAQRVSTRRIAWPRVVEACAACTRVRVSSRRARGDAYFCATGLDQLGEPRLGDAPTWLNTCLPVRSKRTSSAGSRIVYETRMSEFTRTTGRSCCCPMKFSSCWLSGLSVMRRGSRRLVLEALCTFERSGISLRHGLHQVARVHDDDLAARFSACTPYRSCRRS